MIDQRRQLAARLLPAARRQWAQSPAIRAAHGTLCRYATTLAELRMATGAGSAERVVARLSARAEQARVGAGVLARLRGGDAAAPPYLRAGHVLHLYLLGPVMDDADGEHLTGLLDTPTSVARPAPILAALEAHADAAVTVWHVDSMGGSVAALERLTAAMQTHRGRSIAIVETRAWSAACFLALAADKVWMRTGSTLQLHRARLSATGDHHALTATARELRIADGVLERQVARQRRLPHPVVAELMAGERYLPADEALSLGLADRVLPALDLEPRLPGSKDWQPLPMAQQTVAENICNQDRDTRPR